MNRIRIAYVEDEPSIADLLAQGLGLFGMMVDPIYMTAELFLENHYSKAVETADIFVFDIRLPRMTGIDLARQLRARGETRPFLLVSAWPPPSQAELNAIGAKFLPKPFDFSAMVQTIQTIVQQSKI
jgi:DNA-binding response OmpR family regulator